jgi:hypothetical protein
MIPGIKHNFNIRISVLLIFYALTLYSCLQDDLFSEDIFAGPSEFKIEFQSGTFSGKTYDIISKSPISDHEFLVAQSIQKILSKPLQEKTQNTLSTKSFINWAWQGDTTTGQFAAIFATDPNISKSGDLQLSFTNGDELVSSIPKGALIEIESFGGPQGAIQGNISYTSTLDYRINNISNREQASLYISFKIKRGPNN